MIGKDSDPQNLPEDAAFNYLGSWSGRNRVSSVSRKVDFSFSLYVCLNLMFDFSVLQIYQMNGKDSGSENWPADRAFNYLGSWSGRNRQVFCASRKLSFIVPSSDKKMSDHI